MKNRIEKITKKGQEKVRDLFLFKFLVFTFTTFFILLLSYTTFAMQTDEPSTISQFEQYLASSSYSDFQKRMVLNSVEQALEEGISSDDTLLIIKGSIENGVDAYNVKKFLDTVISAKGEGLSEKTLINKIKEGLAKDVDERMIINVLNQRSENMKIAQMLLKENEIQNGEPEKMIDILADSLANGVPTNVLAQVLEISSAQGKDWTEVEMITKELGNLGLKATELGMGSDKIEVIFNQALEKESSLEEICINIQELIIAAIAVQVSSSSQIRDNSVGSTDTSVISGSDLPTTSSGSTISSTGSGNLSGETGSSPVSQGENSTTDNESGSSPLE